MNDTYPIFYGNRRMTLSQYEQQTTIRNIDPEVWRRVRAMMIAAKRAGIDLGVGTGWRSSERQRQMFLERHDQVACPGQINWDNKCWRRKPGVAAAAPPGRSYHEETTPDGKALALDMVPTASFAWMQANVSRFGLKTFRDVNNEPWHIQPVEVPNGRSRYNPATHHPLPRWPLPANLDNTPTPQPQPQPQPTGATYLVQPGDSYWRIADKVLGDGARWKEISEMNANRPLKAGDRIRIPHVVNPDGIKPHQVLGETNMYSIVTPQRVIDTRNTNVLGPDEVVVVSTGSPRGAKAAHVNITGLFSRPGFLTAWAGGPRPNTSILNGTAAAGAVANAVTVPLDNSGRFNIYTSGGAHVIVDVMGFHS